MDDIASCVACWGDTPYLPELLNGSMRTTGIRGSIVAVATHGTNNGSLDWVYNGFIFGHETGDQVQSRLIEPHPSYAHSTEIMMVHACSFMQINNYVNWHGFRNAHRYGLRVFEGCWGTAGQATCYLTSGIINNTWNEIGDEIADVESRIWFSWREGHTVLYEDDDLISNGLGKKSNADCDNRAWYVTYQNRNNWTDYDYGHDESYYGDYEVCGYYVTNI